MADRIVRALIKGANLLAVSCVATNAAQEARRRHGLAPSSAAFLGQGLTAGYLLGSLQKAEATRINLQLECDGPVRGLFVDADTTGRARGYVRSKGVHFTAEPRFNAAPLLGTTGYISVLRDIEGEFYRGAVGLDHRDLSLDLETYFAKSEQVETALQLEALRLDNDELGWVGGLLIQRLPDGDSSALHELRARLRSNAVAEAALGGATSAHALCESVLGADSLELLADQQVEYFCPCTRERVMRALRTLSNVDLIEMITQDKKASVNCDFCGQGYEITEAELREVLDFVDQRDAAIATKKTSGTDESGNPLN